MQEGKEYLTKEKHRELTKEFEELTKVKRKEIAEQLEYAKGLGDLSENAEYHEARDEQARIEGRINFLEDLLKKAEILKHKKSDVTDVGSTIIIKKTKTGEKFTYEIVGPEEADMTSGKVSYQSPLGSAIIGKKKGEEFTFETPKGKANYKVVSVE